MKNWNRTGKIKAIVLAIFALPNLIVPANFQAEFGVAMTIAPLIFPIFIIPLFVAFNRRIFHQAIEKPNWNDNPITFKRPLSFYQFTAFFFLVVGLSILIGTVIKYRSFNYFGLSSISFGIGILAGIWLTIKRSGKKR